MVTLNPDGTFVYSPNSEMSRLGGTDSFTAVVIDRMGRSNLVRITVVVRANSAPTAPISEIGAPDPRTGAVSGMLSATDPEGEALTYGGSGPTPKGAVTVDPLTGQFVYTPTSEARHAAAGEDAAPADLTDVFTATVTDSLGGTTPLPVSVPITPFNTPPVVSLVAGLPDRSTGVVSGSASGSDADGDALSYAATSGPALGSLELDAATGSFTYTPTVAARSAVLAGTGASTDSFTVTVSDGHGGSVTQVVTVAIASANAAPTASFSAGSPNVSTGVVSGSVTGSDADGDTLSYAATSGPALGSLVLDAATGSFTYTPTASARHAAAVPGGVTADSFTVTVSDGQGGSVTQVVTVAIAPTNTNPTATSTAGSPNVSTGVVSGSVTGSDADGDTLSYAATSGPALGSLVLDAATGSFTYTPTAPARHAAAASGGVTSDSFTVTVSDGHGGSVTQVVTVTIAPANTPPTASFSAGSPNVSTGVVSGSVTGSDADGDTLTYTKTADPVSGSVVVSSGGSFTYTPTASARHAAAAPGGVTTDSFTVTVSDGHGGSVTQVVTVAIEPANTAPTATVSAGTPDATTGVVTATVTGSDADADPLTYTVNADPTNGSVSPSLGTVTGPLSSGASTTFTYTPTDAARVAAGSGGPTTDTFTVRVSDGYGGFVDKIVTVAISPTSSTTVNTTATSASSPLSISTLGSFTDPSTGLTITRTDTQTSLSFSGSANWEFVTVVYDSDPGAAVVNQTDTVYKTQGPNTVGVLTRVSNKQITVALPRTTAFDLQIKYNGQSTGYIYIAAV